MLDFTIALTTVVLLPYEPPIWDSNQHEKARLIFMATRRWPGDKEDALHMQTASSENEEIHYMIGTSKPCVGRRSRILIAMQHFDVGEMSQCEVQDQER
jgi:hypothetical protein